MCLASKETKFRNLAKLTHTYTYIHTDAFAIHSYHANDAQIAKRPRAEQRERAWIKQRRRSWRKRKSEKGREFVGEWGGGEGRRKRMVRRKKSWRKFMCLRT